MSAAYTIQMASKISGVGVHTIRAWEKRYKALEPIRDSSGHRVYTKIDIEKLMLLSELCLLGYSISKVANLSIEDLKKLLIELGKPQTSLEQGDFSLIDENPQMDGTQSMPILMLAAKSCNIDVISQELGKLKYLVSPKDFALNVIMPLNTVLNQSYNNGELSLNQLNALKGLLKFHLGYFLYCPKKRESGEQSLVLGQLEESDDLAISCAGALCLHYKLNYTYVGAMSAEALVEYMKFSEATVLVLGSTSDQSDTVLEKIIQKCKVEAELVILGPKRIPQNLFGKKISVLKTLNQIDDYLLKKSR